MDQATEVNTANEVKGIQLVNELVSVEYGFKSVKQFTDMENKTGPIMEKDKDGKEKQKEIRRPNFVTNITVPSLESLFAGCETIKRQDVFTDVEKLGEDGKKITVKEVSGWEYVEPEHRCIFEMITDALKDAGKETVDTSDDNASVKFSADVFDFAKFARAEKYARKAGSLEKELLEELCKSYEMEMKKIGKPEKGIKIACHYFMRRAKGLDVVKTEIVKGMRANLGTWFTAIDDDGKNKFAKAFELLDKRMSEALDPNNSVM